MSVAQISADLVERLAKIRVLCMDVDGVMTDGHLYYAGNNEWSQRFSVQDGFGIKLLQQMGIAVAILSGGDVPSARARAQSLSIEYAYFGLSDKVAAFGDVAGTLGVTPTECAFIGDELVDIPLLKMVGVAATVPESVDEVKAVVHYVTRRPGGSGAVRELCDLIRAHRK